MRALRGAFLSLVLVVAVAMPAFAAGKAADHHIVIQVSQKDPTAMSVALHNAVNAIKYYKQKGEKVEIEVVAYGPGLNMLRADTSPVKDRIKALKASAMGAVIRFSACHNTEMAMQKREGHPIKIIPEAQVIPSGVVRVAERQEEGWSYVRP